MDRIEFYFGEDLIAIRRSQKNLFSIDVNRSFSGYMFTSAKEISFNPECKMNENLRRVIIDKLKETLRNGS